MSEQLTPTERNALKWVQFDERMAEICNSQSGGAPDSLTLDRIWRLWKILGGGENSG